MDESEEGDKETPKIFLPYDTLHMLHFNMSYGLDWSLELISFNLLWFLYRLYNIHTAEAWRRFRSSCFAGKHQMYFSFDSLRNRQHRERAATKRFGLLPTCFAAPLLPPPGQICLGHLLQTLGMDMMCFFQRHSKLVLPIWYEWWW